MLQGDATEQTPPDLPSFLFKERIVYLVNNPFTSHALQRNGQLIDGEAFVLHFGQLVNIELPQVKLQFWEVISSEWAFH